MMLDRGFALSYLFAGLLFVFTTVLAVGPLFGLTWEVCTTFLHSLSKLGTVAEIAALFLLVSVAYPIGYIINFASYTLWNKGARGTYLNKAAGQLPIEIKKEVAVVYGVTDHVPASLKWDFPGYELMLMRLAVQASDASIYREAKELWGTASRFTRVFSLTFALLAVVWLVVAVLVTLTGNDIHTKAVLWSGLLLTLMMGGSCSYSYMKVLPRETKSIIARYLTLRAMGKLSFQDRWKGESNEDQKASA